MIANNEVLTNPSYTIGCSVEVKLHEFKEDTSAQKAFFIEFFDVGGSLSHKNSRSVFYQQANGIILVHDCTNRKSHENLKNCNFYFKIYFNIELSLFYFRVV